MNLAISLALVYIIVMPILFRIGPSLLHKKLIIERKTAKAKNNKAALRDIPKPIWPIWSEHISFTMKDKRNLVLKKPKKGSNEEPKVSNIQNRQLFFMLWGAGLLAVLIGAFIGSPLVYGFGFVGLFNIAMGFGVNSAKSLLKARQAVYDRMFSIAKLKLGQSAEYTDNPRAVITVLEWNDYVKPQKVELQVPDSFGAEGEEGFMRQFNQIFGTETTWVPADDPETHAPGWDYQEGKVTIYAVPPLPQMAPWDEHYVLDPGVAWSFFPIALGVENGLEVPNPKTGAVENVLGFDLSGEAAKVAKAAGYKISPTVTTSPMCLAGDTLIGLADGSFKKIREIAEDRKMIEVLSLNSSNELVSKRMVQTHLTRRNAEVWRIHFSDNSHVDITPDHELRTPDGRYVAAQDFTDETRIAGFGQDSVSIEKIEVRPNEDVYDGEVEDTHNFVVVTNEDLATGIISKNCFVGGGTGGGKALAVDTLVEVVSQAR